MINIVSITDLKQNTKSVVDKVKSSGQPVIILQRSEVAAVLVDPNHYQYLEQALEDLEDLRAIEERKNEPARLLNDYLIKRFGEKKTKSLLK